MSHSDGEAVVKDPQNTLQFDCLVNLTRLFDGLVVRKHDIGDDDVVDITGLVNDIYDHDSASVWTNLDSQANDNCLLEKFLDRFAEVASSEKGAWHVTNTVFDQTGNEAKLFVSSNVKYSNKRNNNSVFSKKSLNFFKDVTRHLQTIATNGFDSTKGEFWSCLLEYQRPRLVKTYISSTEELLNELLDEASFTELAEGCEGTHDMLHELRTCSLKIQTSPTTALLGEIVQRGLELRRSPDGHECLHSHDNGVKLWEQLCFLGRLGAAYECFVETARRFPSFKSISIIPVTDAMLTAVSLSGHSKFDEHVGQSSLEELCDTLSPLSVEDAHRLKDMCAKPRHMHSEVQLMVYLARSGHLETIYPYIGGSRYCCVLCHDFVEAFGRCKVRGCHGKLYDRWILPTTDIVPLAYKARLQQATAQIEAGLLELHAQHEPGEWKTNHPESSAGVTRINLESQQSTVEEETIRSWKEETRLLQQQRLTVSMGNPTNGSYRDDCPEPERSLAAKDEHIITDKQCIMCDSSEAKRCNRCRSTLYCSKKCQQEDWALHKLLCSKMGAFLSERPSPNHRAAISLPGLGKAPVLVWIKCEGRRVEDHDAFHASPPEPAPLSDEGPMTQRTEITQTSPSSLDLSYKVIVTSRYAFLRDDSRCGPEMSHMVSMFGRKGLWNGPGVVMAQDIDCKNYRDIRLADLRIAVDCYGSSLIEDVKKIEEGEEGDARFKRGIKITCKGDRALFGEENCHPVELRATNKAFLMPNPQHDISRRLGLPLIIYKMDLDRAWIDKDHPHYHVSASDNPAVTFLRMNCDPKSSSWGWAPWRWQDEVASVVILCEEERTVTPRQIESVLLYCQKVLQPLFEDSIGGGLVQRTREEVLEHITPQAFRQYFARLKESKEREDDYWLHEVCPV